MEIKSTTTRSLRLDYAAMGKTVKITDLAYSKGKIHMKYTKIHIKERSTDMLLVLLQQF